LNQSTETNQINSSNQLDSMTQEVELTMQDIANQEDNPSGKLKKAVRFLRKESLNWAVAEAVGLTPALQTWMNSEGLLVHEVRLDPPEYDRFRVKVRYNPAFDWSVAGPLIEEFGITVSTTRATDYWVADIFVTGQETLQCTTFGATAIEAALRCLALHRLGEEVEIPSELI